jgi:hypothetical protein
MYLLSLASYETFLTKNMREREREEREREERERDKRLSFKPLSATNVTLYLWHMKEMCVE